MRRLPELIAISIFVATSLLAILVSWVLNTQEGVQGASSNTQSTLYIVLFLVLTLIFSAGILYFARKRGMRIIRAVFIIISIYVVFVVSLPLSFLIVNGLNYVVPLSDLVAYTMLYGIWFAIPVYMAWALIFRPEWYVVDALGILLSVGLSAIWGITLNAWFSVALLSIFAVYDYIAVYRTKHMVDLADTSIKSGMPMLFFIPERRGIKMKDVSIEQGRKGTETMLLGYGDIALPSIMVVSSARLGNFAIFPFVVLPIVGAVIGMIILFAFARKPAPGLPFINSGVILGFLFSVVISMSL
ncbi:MAG: presenilin family intramembrane aspartyl protease [Candidatus Thermoplasmatota archaeon]|jgi:presenilin-like A22 family membrane protease|nr:presenilin family intramembrane aspartyl protease [Candidatus Thermoplasmatota archaeon]MCL5785549.1 presenilin family intramembrane aspartyl protease [Candidatus Thermoplasmatota archaeon]